MGFGSEFGGLAMDGPTKTVFLIVSVVAFLCNLCMADAFNQMIADLGRVPDSRMHECVVLILTCLAPVWLLFRR